MKRRLYFIGEQIAQTWNNERLKHEYLVLAWVVDYIKNSQNQTIRPANQLSVTQKHRISNAVEDAILAQCFDEELPDEELEFRLYIKGKAKGTWEMVTSKALWIKERSASTGFPASNCNVEI